MAARPISAVVLFEALAALKAVKDSPGLSVPSHLWKQSMYAFNHLQAEVILCRLSVPVAIETESTETA